MKSLPLTVLLLGAWAGWASAQSATPAGPEPVAPPSAPAQPASAVPPPLDQAPLQTSPTLSSPAPAQEPATERTPSHAVTQAAPGHSSLPERARSRDPRPSSGVGQRVVGFIGIGLGVVNLATIPLCFTELIEPELEDLCVGASVAIGAVGLGVGIPMLVIGYNKRAESIRWRERNGFAAHMLNMRLSIRANRTLLSYRGRF